MKQFLAFLLCVGFISTSFSQQFFEETPAARKWVKKQYRKLSKDQRIAQLLVIRAHSNLGQDHVTQVTKIIQEYNVGGLCFFQGGPVRQALLTNYYQQIAKTPIMIAIDGEWGLGMRLDSVINYPRQLMMGAVPDATLIYRFGRAVGEQCKRLGIHVNYAPDIDVNNNPLNPVINDRSFGEDKYRVALYGAKYMKGMQDVGVMACAKHFPGHGDVAVDSHYDLPIINKSRAQLDELELFPFRELIQQGVGSIMSAHLYIPAIDTTANQATTLSRKNVTDLLKNELGFKGIAVTDALEMKGVTKFYPQGEAAVQAIIAGNDMLCLPGDVKETINKVRQAIKDGKISWKEINSRVYKILLAKYHLGLNKSQVIDTTNLVADLNQSTIELKKELASQSITLLRHVNQQLFPLNKKQKIAYVQIGAPTETAIAKKLRDQFGAKIYSFGSRAAVGKELMDDLNSSVVRSEKNDSAGAATFAKNIQQEKFDIILIGVHNYSRRPANNFGIPAGSIQLLNLLQDNNTSTIYFGNPYAISNTCIADNLWAAYEDDESTQTAMFNILVGEKSAVGKLPVTVCDGLNYGTGIVYSGKLPYSQPERVGLKTDVLEKIEKVALSAIDQGAFPGCVVLVARNGKVAYHRAFGFMDSAKTEPLQVNTVFDVASVTKTSATTVAVMKMVDEGKISLSASLGDYLPWVRGTNKEKLRIDDILLHQAGLTPFIPFYRELIDKTSGKVLPQFFSTTRNNTYSTPVAKNLFLRNDWQDSLLNRILKSPLSEHGKYVYSDNDFIFLGKIVEQLSGLSLDEYVQKTFYSPLQMLSTQYNPLKTMSEREIAPTEMEPHFRGQLIRGYVHDEGASLFGGVAGHAGLFSNAYDLAKLYQMLLQGGKWGNAQILNPSTVQLFTKYGSDVSRRGLGFDKPEKDNAHRNNPYPAKNVSPQTFGHTGFTGTCVWVDPAYDLVYVFLSNRVHPTRSNNKISSLQVRGRIQDIVYEALLIE